MTAPATTTTTSKSKSRRALLAGALGGLGAWTASAVGRVSPVRAENEYIQIGHEYATATSRTRIRNEENNATVFRAEAWALGTALEGYSSSGSGVVGTTASGTGVFGYSASNTGVYGNSNSGVAVYGDNGAPDRPAISAQARANSTGVFGYSGPGFPPAAKPKTGMYGHANQDAGSKGVWGFSGRGAGVYGQANKNGFAIRARGRIKADKVSGVATIPSGSTGVTVSPGVNVTGGSFVLLTPRANIGSRGLWYTVQASSDTFKIRMSSSRSSNTVVAWLLLG